MNDEAPGYRQRQAEATRSAIAATARELFGVAGYTGTTIEKISRHAGIPQQTIYSALGSKAAILERVRRDWIAAADVAHLHAEALSVEDPAEGLRRAAHWTRRQFELGIDVIAVHQQAALADPRVAEAWESALRGREAAVRQLVDSLAGSFRPGLDASSALDVYIALTVPEIYVALVTQRGWSPDRYESWLGDALITQLLSLPAQAGSAKASV